MRRHFSPLAAVSAAIVLVIAGCSPQQPFYFSPPTGNGDRYIGMAQQIEYPDLETISLDEVNGAKAPFTLDNPKPENYWDLRLEEAIRIALANSTVVRNLGNVQFGPTGALGVPSALLQSAQSAASIYIPAQTETDPRFGVEAALSAFDAQFSSSIFWEKNIIPQNTAGLVRTFRPDIYQQDVGNFTGEIAKTAADGTQFAIRHNMRYNMDNTAAIIPGLLPGNATKRFPNDWTADVQAEFRHPFLQGQGVNFNRIAGPGATAGQANGVMIARLRTDQSLTDFEAAVRNLCNDVERAYWNLYYAYRRLDSVVAGRDAALQTWRQAKARFDVGGAHGSAQEEAQARENYLLFKATVEQTQSNLYKTENLVRYMMGIAHSDGRLIRPADEPTKAKVEFDWYDAHAEALTRAVEIRRQKWVIKQRELELIAAKNYLLPRLDAVGRYSFTGLGDLMLDPGRSLVQRDPSINAATGRPFDTTLIPHSAYGSMTTGDYPSWHLGLEFRLPIGFRREMAGVRFAQLNLVRERKVLEEQELELDHQLADAFRDLSQNYVLSQTNYNRWLAARREVEAVNAAYKVGTTTLDQVLDAQRRQAEAENEYYRTLVDYTLAITTVHFRKGSLLEYDGVFLAEGPWPAKAYFDARRRARHREASSFVNYGFFTQPRIVSQGPYEQAAGQMVPDGEMPAEAPLPVGQPKPMGPEQTEPLAPLPMEEAPAAGGKPGLKVQPSPPARRSGEADQGRRVVPTTRVGHNGGSAAKGYDLAAQNLRDLGSASGPAPAGTAEISSEVRPAGHQEAGPAPEPTGPPPSPAVWKSTTRSAKTDEPVANPPPAPTHPSASGWKSVQHGGARSEL